MNVVGGIQDLMASSPAPMLSAFLLGLLVAFSPCPLSTNLAALAYLGRRATEPSQVVAAGALYAAGRMASYTALLALLVLAGVEVSGLSWLLQDVEQYLLGPLLVLAGLLVLGALPLRLPSALGKRGELGQRLAEAGPAGAFGLGALLSLTFCPYSAALFFGALLPLALGPAGGPALAPTFALGTGLPVLVVACLLSAGTAGASGWFDLSQRLEPALRWASGLAFLGAGVYSLAAWLPL